MECRHMQAALRRIFHELLKHGRKHECQETSYTRNIETLLISEERFFLCLVPESLPAMSDPDKGTSLSREFHMADSFVPDKQGISKFFLQRPDPSSKSRLCDI